MAKVILQYGIAEKILDTSFAKPSYDFGWLQN